MRRIDSEKLSGFLQKWVTPRGPHNSVIRIEWVDGQAPERADIVTRTTKVALDCARADADARVATFEGRPHDATETPLLCPRLRSNVVDTCARMSRHIAASSGGLRLVKRMTCLFKIAAPAGRLVLLWCPSLSLVELSPLAGSVRGAGRRLSRPGAAVGIARDGGRGGANGGALSPELEMSDKLRDVREAARAVYEERAERVGELVREGHLSVVEGAQELSAGQRKLEAASAGARGIKERTSVLEGMHICVICNDIVTQATTRARVHTAPNAATSHMSL